MKQPISILTPPASLPRLTPAEELLRLRDYLSVELPGADSIYVGESEPTGAAFGAPWLRIDGVGRPVGLFIRYNGRYVRLFDAYTNEVRGFAGAPTVVAEPWYFCDGTNGTQDLRAAMVDSNGATGQATTQAAYRLGYMQFKGYT